MKSLKTILSSVFAMLAVCFLFANVMMVQAEERVDGKVYVAPYENVKGKLKDTTKLRVLTDEFKSIRIHHGAGDKIQKLKVNKKGLSAAVTTYSSDNITSRDYGYSYLEFYGTKPGKYKVSFSVVGVDGKTVAKKSITVQVVHSNATFKKISFGSQVVQLNTVTFKNGTKKIVNKSNTKVKGSSGVLRVTPNSQYKVTGIIVEYVDKNGKLVYKKIKNGGTVTLSKTYSRIEKSTTSYSRSSKKYTTLYISYKDTFFGDTCKYSIVKNRGRKEVKRVYKNAQTGRTEVSYSQYSSVDLWQY